MIKVERQKFRSIVAAAAIFAAFFAICIVPLTAEALGMRSGSMFEPTPRTTNYSPGGQPFYSSGYAAETAVWPAVKAAANGAFAGSIQFTSATYSIDESGTTASILVERTLGTEGPVTIQYTVSSGTATEEQDFSTTAGTIFWSDGDDSLQGFTIPILEDNLSEGNETVIITLSNPTGGAVIGSPNPVVLTIIDNEPVAAIPTISINDVTQAEGNAANQMVFTVTLSTASTQTVTVNVATADGTATSGSDFTGIASQVLTFSPGETTKQIVININGDTALEANESFFVNLTGAANATISDGQGTGTLTNDDAAGAVGSVQFSSVTYAINENSATATITVTRTFGSSGAVTVNYATSNGTATAGLDYTAVSGTLVWADGDFSPKSFTIPIATDIAQESNETVIITLSNPTGGVTIGSPNSAVLTILDDDSPPTISISDVTLPEGNGPNQLLFNITLSTPTGQPVTVRYSTANGTALAGSDYTSVIAGLVTFNPGETLKQIAIDIVGDFIVEPDETFFVDLSDATNASIFDSQGVGILLNDDTAGVIFFESATFSVNEGTPVAIITVRRTGGLSSGVSVQYSSIDGTATAGQDFTRVTGVLVFAPGETTRTFTIPIINDQIDEPDETLNLALENPTGGAVLGSPINAIVTIVDDDATPTISINDISRTEGDAGTTAFNFTVSVDGQSSQVISVNYSTANGSAVAPGDFTAIQNATVTFNPGQTSKQITVLVNGDYARELNETFFLNLSGAIGAFIADAQGEATIVNDDVGGAFRFNSASYTAGEPSGSITITVLRTGGLAGNVTVNYATSNGTATAGQDYTAVSGTLTFAGGQTTQTFIIPIANDGVLEGDETVNIILSDASGGATVGNPNTAVLTITDFNATPVRPVLFDYDGDRKADISVRRPSDNTWYLRRVTAAYTSVQLGNAGDLMVPADYDGDNITDVAVFKPATGAWLILNSSTQTLSGAGWGAAGDLPVPADYNGDGRTDLVVFRPSTGQWYLRFSGSNSFSQVGFGVAGDKPVRGDFDGDGRSDIGVFRPSDGNWYILKSSFGFFIQTWGVAGDIPVPGDYDGDGNTDIAVYRPSTGKWHRVRSMLGFDEVSWGVSSDLPAPADYDGDGRVDVAVFRPSNGTWYVIGTSVGFNQTVFGQNGDQPTPGAFIY